MNPELCDFVRLKIAEVEQSIKARSQANRAGRGGTDKEWKAVGCTKTKAQRIALADIEQKIQIKLERQLSNFNAILQELSKMNVGE